MALKLAQINAQRSSAVSADLEMIMREKNIDVLCLQEPYVIKGKVRGSSNLIITQPDSEKTWITIITREDKFQVFRVAYKESEHIMCIHIITEFDDFIIINAYCQFSLQIEPFLNKIEKMLQKVKDKKVLIAMDSNANSSLWFSKETDERGRQVEEFLLQNDMYVLNKSSNVSTYVSVQGESNIDLTMASGNVLSSIQDWQVLEACTTSNHNMISYNFKYSITRQRTLVKQRNFNIKKAD